MSHREPGAAREPDPAEQVQAIERVMNQAGRWACLIGPQAAGKTTYAQYLQICNRGVPPHEWSLHQLVDEVTDSLRIERIEAAPSLPLLPRGAAPVDPARGGFHSVAGTRDILHFQAVTGRGEPLPGTVPVHFFDVPGEWPRPTDHDGEKRKAGQIAPMERLLARTELFVLFIPFWALLPERWLTAEAARVAGRAIWGTSLAAGVGDVPDPAELARAAAAAHADVDLWIDALLGTRRKELDLLVVLSQFQQDVVERLLDGHQTGLGTALWRQYHDLLDPRAPAGRDALGELTSRMSRLRGIGLDLFRAIDDESRRAHQGGSLTLDALDRLVKFRRRAGSAGKDAERRRIRSLTIYPLNTVDLSLDRATRLADGRTLSTFQLFAEEGGDTKELRDFRMCADVVWWIILQLKADKIWMP